MGGRKGLILFPEGCDERGWSRVSGELSKPLAFLPAMDWSLSSGGPPAGNRLVKEAGLPSFMEVVLHGLSASRSNIRFIGCRKG
jgi:hypothetical protein